MNKPEESQSTTSEQVVYERVPVPGDRERHAKISRNFACCPNALGKLPR